MKTTKQLARELGLLRKRSLSKDSTQNGLKRPRTCQLFSYLIVIDFESTCWENEKTKTQEIIEFPAVLLNTVTGVIESEFHFYLQPQEHPTLSSFCHQLTGITQDQVDNGIPLSLCLRKFSHWLHQLSQQKNVTVAGDPHPGSTSEQSSSSTDHKLAAFVTWSDWDLGVCLHYELKRKQIAKAPCFCQWIDLRATYVKFYGRKPKGLNGALQDVGIEFEGREHSGLHDSRNTAKLAWRMIRDGCVMKITKSLSNAVSIAICPPQARNPRSRTPKKKTPKKKTPKKKTPAKTTRTQTPVKKATPAKRTPGKKTPLKRTSEKTTKSLSKRQEKSPSSTKTLEFVCYEDPSDGITANDGKNVKANMTSCQLYPGLKLRDANISNTAKRPGDSFKASYNTPEKISKSAGRKCATPDKCAGSSPSCRRSPRLQALRTEEEKKASPRSKKCLMREPTAKGDTFDTNVNPIVHTATGAVTTSGSMHKGVNVSSIARTGTTTPVSCKNLLNPKQHQQSNLSTPSGIKTSVFQTPSPSSVFRTPSPVNPHLHAATGTVKGSGGFTHKGVVSVRTPSASSAFRTPSPLNAVQTPSFLNTFRTPSSLHNPTGLGSFRTPLQRPQASASKMKATPPLCRCGRRSKRRMVQNPGPNMGRWFFSCGKGTQCPDSGDAKKAGCTFFLWEPSQGTPSASPYRPICHSVNRSYSSVSKPFTPVLNVPAAHSSYRNVAMSTCTPASTARRWIR